MPSSRMSLPVCTRVTLVDVLSSQQPNPTTQKEFTDNWIRLILAYARHRKLFFLRVEDAEVAGGDWDEVLRNERINRK